MIMKSAFLAPLECTLRPPVNAQEFRDLCQAPGHTESIGMTQASILWKCESSVEPELRATTIDPKDSVSSKW